MDDHTITSGPIRSPDQIIPGLYLSDLHTAQDAAVATSIGITHIVSVLDFVPTFPQEMEHIKKMHVRLSDSFREKITPHLDDTTTFIREALDGDPENKILVRLAGLTYITANPLPEFQVHCVMGISRSATVVCAYLIAEKGMTAPAAIDFVRGKRPVVCPNVGFQRQLGEYAIGLHGEEFEMQMKLGEVTKNIRGFGKLWMRGVMNMSKKKEADPDAS
ncbi:protein-tyrosine phosphatase-like protein [Thelephora terrestris]|uniref:Protein-tyrosine phosphatase-like protein n=1 Tax=Thelephora terrestris TaxID=56493 RepID=A0A9P6L6K4_9AGAM|nr:protein-tyrosine phosphatase-like protein [Thelephora terrestris]